MTGSILQSVSLLSGTMTLFSKMFLKNKRQEVEVKIGLSPNCILTSDLVRYFSTHSCLQLLRYLLL